MFPLVISLVFPLVFLVFFAGSAPFVEDRAIRVLPYIKYSTLESYCDPLYLWDVKELAKLLEVEFIREIKHPDWLANLVMVPKKDKSWRLCVDFKDLNKACPKDPFPLPCID